VVGAKGFEPSTSWSRTRVSENLMSFRCRTYGSIALENLLLVGTHGTQLRLNEKEPSLTKYRRIQYTLRREPGADHFSGPHRSTAGHAHTASLLVRLRGRECDTAGPVAAETVFPEHFRGERAAVVCLKGQTAGDYFSRSAQSLVRSATKLNARLRQPF
jgi:hypothetical protein